MIGGNLVCKIPRGGFILKLGIFISDPSSVFFIVWEGGGSMHGLVSWVKYVKKEAEIVKKVVSLVSKSYSCDIKRVVAQQRWLN
jgi:hypothetical protein